MGRGLLYVHLWDGQDWEMTTTEPEQEESPQMGDVPMTRKENPLEELEKAYAQWESLYKQGGSDPFYPDGVNLNLVRNHILYFKRQIEEPQPPVQE